MKNKNKGSSLIYILIILSVMSIVTYTFFDYVYNKNKNFKLDGSIQNKQILKKRLIKKEKKQAKIISSRKYGYYEYMWFLMGRQFSTNYVKNDGAYFNIYFYDSDTEDAIQYLELRLVKLFKKMIEEDCLVYADNKSVKSIGGYEIVSVKSSRGYETLPLRRDKDYGIVTVRYRKKILGITLEVEERMKFVRDEVYYTSVTIDYKFINGDKYD
ncbi:hypothetical protein [Sneathia sanguinegens]|jgi:hypothetical protein|uniref:hypothetical protein n=1 Tax=Sneathia sanguinegens TaxID=40543 RepID=UPI0008296A76|nr:hypothetical protein [Sneathia sanguinegens]MDU4652242.1 hypothetical protein [Sneathia sanguinegens]